MALNTVVLTGRTVEDITVKTTNGGKRLANIRLAVDAGNDQTYFFDCVAWNNLAEAVAKNVGKGSLIGVSGQLTQSTYEDKNGNKRNSVQILVQNVSFEQTKKPGSVADAENAENADYLSTDILNW